MQIRQRINGLSAEDTLIFQWQNASQSEHQFVALQETLLIRE